MRLFQAALDSPLLCSHFALHGLRALEVFSYLFFFLFRSFSPAFSYDKGKQLQFTGKWGVSLRPCTHRLRSEPPDFFPGEKQDLNSYSGGGGILWTLFAIFFACYRGWNGVWGRGCDTAELGEEKRLFNEFLVRNWTGKEIQWRGFGHSVNRRTSKIDISLVLSLRESPKNSRFRLFSTPLWTFSTPGAERPGNPFSDFFSFRPEAPKWPL